MMLASFPAARMASAALNATVMVIGFNIGDSVVSSKALPVAVKLVGRVGISTAERGR